MKGQGGFSLIEVTIVLLIIVALAMVTIPIQRTIVRRSMVKEGKVVAKNVANAERLYKSDYAGYLAIGTTDYSEMLGIDNSGNKYFKNFSVFISGTESETADFTVTLVGEGSASGMTVEYIKKYNDDNEVINEYGL